MELSEILGPEAVRAPIKVHSKKRLFQELSEMAASSLGLDQATVLQALLEREGLGPTGVGHGVAIPHARIADIDHVAGIFVRLEQPIEFDAVDRKPVDLIFMLLAPKSAGAEHLKALARVSRTLRDENTCRKLRSTSDVTAIYAILTETSASKAA